jgi:diguanylate cyclase (GGDEF)-like protein
MSSACAARPAVGARLWTASAFALFDDLGMLGVLHLDTEAALSEAQQRLVGSLLRFYGNFRCLVHDNERDLLTGLYNRKPFDEHFDRALDTVSASADGATPSSWLAVFDLDHFKRVNDLFGHLVGDEVLLLVGRLLRQSFRFSDKVFRFGGEEFVLLLRGADAEDSLRVLERFRERVATHEFPQVGQMSVSIGYTALKPDDTPHSALERADRAVYAAKEGGRNRVCHFERLVSEGLLAPQEAGGSVDFF